MVAVEPNNAGVSQETLQHLMSNDLSWQFNVVYTAVDVETDGPIPGMNSMRNLGAVALNLDNVLLSSWTANFEPLPEAMEDPATMKEFWDKNPEAWEAVNRNKRDPAEAIPEYIDWLHSLPTRPVLSVYPSWDSIFYHWYAIRFAGEDPTSFAAFCAKSFSAGVLGLPFRESAKRNYPRGWFDPALQHTHDGLDDALGQGVMAVNAVRQSIGLDPKPLTRGL